jgi:hypothetical protein
VSRLCERLDDAFGSENVFFDERSIGTGGDFLGQVGGAIYTSDVILVVIGQDWATIRDSRGRLRLNDADDPVRWEVGLALASGRVLVPVLVGHASMPSKGDVPRDLRDITTRSGVRLEAGAGFDASVDDLIERLGGPRRHAGPRSYDGGRPPRRTAAWTTFEANWQTQDGGMTQITQDGDLVELHGSGANGAVFQGRGRIVDRHAILDFASSYGVCGRLVLELVSNGAYLNGQLQTPMGTMPFQMMRRT